jgi:hypothetical protein
VVHSDRLQTGHCCRRLSPGVRITIGHDLPDPTPWIRNIAVVPGNDMKVQVIDAATRRATFIYSNSKSIRGVSICKFFFGLTRQVVDSGYFVRAELEE